MDVLEAVRTQRAIRAFRPDALPEAVLRTILDAGRRAASSKNQQRWAFIVIRDRTTLERLSMAGPWAGHLAGASVAVALVTPAEDVDDRLSVMWDLGRAAQNMTLAAWALGVGSVPATVYEQDMAREILGYPDDRWCEFILSFGYPADPSDLTRPPKKGGRLQLDEVVREERW